jgi:hypothetical protein
MTSTDSVFQRALSNMLREILDGPPGPEAYVLNPGDPGLLRQLDTIDASTASKPLVPGKPTIAAQWREVVASRASWDDMGAAAALSTAAHTAYHVGAIRQILAGLQT